MFDSYHRHSTPDVRVNVNIPQPDAADHKRLYGELLVKAREEIASATIQAGGAHNEIKLVVAQHYNDLLNDRTKVRLLFTVNGKEYDIVADASNFMMEVNTRILDHIFNSALQQMNYYDKVKLLGK